MFAAELSMDPSSIPAHTEWDDMPNYCYSEITVQWDPPECEGALDIVELAPSGSYLPPDDGLLTRLDTNTWKYDAFD